jgi:hypothetical protein
MKASKTLISKMFSFVPKALKRKKKRREQPLPVRVIDIAAAMDRGSPYLPRAQSARSEDAVEEDEEGEDGDDDDGAEGLEGLDASESEGEAAAAAAAYSGGYLAERTPEQSKLRRNKLLMSANKLRHPFLQVSPRHFSNPAGAAADATHSHTNTTTNTSTSTAAATTSESIASVESQPQTAAVARSAGRRGSGTSIPQVLRSTPIVKETAATYYPSKQHHHHHQQQQAKKALPLRASYSNAIKTSTADELVDLPSARRL